MAESTKNSTRTHMLGRLVATAQELSPAQIAEVADFAEFLRSKSTGLTGNGGSKKTITEIIKEVGALEFEPGELKALLLEIEQARDSELEEHD